VSATTWYWRAALYARVPPSSRGALGELLPPVPAPYLYNAVVLPGNHDADTINVDVDWGFRRRDLRTPIRLLGCNARELAQPGGKEARDYVRALLPAGTPVVLATAKPDKYAPRWDAAVIFRLHGIRTDLVAHLIERQWAVPWDGQRSPAPVPPWPRTVSP